MVKKICLLSAIFLILFLTVSSSSHGKVYKWVDSEGMTWITDYDNPASGSGVEAEVPETTEDVVPKTGKTQKKVVLSQPGSIVVKKAAQKTATNPAATAKQPDVVPEAPVKQATLPVPAPDLGSVNGPAPQALPQAQVQLPGNVRPPVNPPMPPDMAGKVAKILSSLFIVLIIISLYLSFCHHLIAKKLDVPMPWLAWVPLANFWIMVKSAGKPDWWTVLLLVPLVNAVLLVYLYMCMAENLGKNKMLGLLTLLPLVNLAFAGYLAFSKHEKSGYPAVIAPASPLADMPQGGGPE